MHRYMARAIDSVACFAVGGAGEAGSRVRRTMAALSVVAFLASSGCDQGADGAAGGALTDASLASVDASGGEIRIEKQIANGSAAGRGGDGGDVRITASSGDVTVTPFSGSLVQPVPLIVGQGLDVVEGGRLAIQGSWSLDFLRIRPGGRLQLNEDTVLIVTGDVDIQGSIVTAFSGGRSDAHDLTIQAGGIVSISGTIDLRGRSNQRAADNFSLAGGTGGELHISAGRAVVDTGAPDLFVSGLIDVSGGDATEAHFASTIARPGKAGQIFLGTSGSMGITGKLLARGGAGGYATQDTFGDGSGAAGGHIELIALSDLTITNAVGIAARGGDSVGAAPGAGGEISVEAPIGVLSVLGSDIDASGGDALFDADATGGLGGNAYIFGNSVFLDAMVVDVDGGKLREREAIGVPVVPGNGGSGGLIELAGITRVDVDRTVLLRANGGDGTVGFAPGAGGNVAIYNLLNSNLDVIDFRGDVEVRGGLDQFGTVGAEGTVCHRGAGASALLRITGSNEFPTSLCQLDQNGGPGNVHFVSRDLDCDTETIIPNAVDARIPAVTGVDFYRVRVGGFDTVRIQTLGTNSGGDLDVYAGEAGLLGSFAFTDYTFASETSNDSDETITIDLGEFSPGAFIAVAVVERGPFVVDYKIEVACGGEAATAPATEDDGDTAPASTDSADPVGRVFGPEP